MKLVILFAFIIGCMASNLRELLLNPATKYITPPPSSSTGFTALITSTGVGALEAPCEVCVYVIENKQQSQPFLCRGLQNPAHQQTCTAVLVSNFWWLENVVYWNEFGCERQVDGNWSFEKPCAAHAICSWLENVNDRTPFCPTAHQLFTCAFEFYLWNSITDANYRKPGAA